MFSARNSTLDCDDSLFEGNNGKYYGSALFLENLVDSKITKSRFISNFVEGELGMGGAIAVIDNGKASSKLSIDESVFDGNSSFFGSALYAMGGSDGYTSNLTISKTVFKNTDAISYTKQVIIGSESEMVQYDSLGGAVFVDRNASVTVKEGVIGTSI